MKSYALLITLLVASSQALTLPPYKDGGRLDERGSSLPKYEDGGRLNERQIKEYGGKTYIGVKHTRDQGARAVSPFVLPVIKAVAPDMKIGVVKNE